MPIYLMLTTLTDEGRKTVKEKPGRIKQVNKEVEKMGVKILSQYALLGAYDFVNILEAPDNQTIARELTPSPLSRQKMGVHLVHSLTSLP